MEFLYISYLIFISITQGVEEAIQGHVVHHMNRFRNYVQMPKVRYFKQRSQFETSGEGSRIEEI